VYIDTVRAMGARLRKRFGERIAALRKVAGLSEEAFAEKCGFARSYMSGVERGKRNPSLDAIETLAVALRVRVHELFDD
jgi:transcriptional regulator with XRE-family HTH domain